MLVEAVPNFSEGRDRHVLGRIAAALDGDGATVLHVDPNPDAHRTVITLAGELEAVCSALFRGVAEATRLIDMRKQHGAHIRVGAADVLPVVALGPGDPRPAVQRLAERLASELEIPIFLYERSALRTPFASLPRCRRGGYEALAERFQDPEDGPDLGPPHWCDGSARSGATVVGVRDLLVAMNFTLDSRDLGLAKGIARAIRTVGPADRADCFPALRAVGWTMPAYEGRVQVSVNLLDPRSTSAHAVLERIRALAGEVAVLGAELIGLTPARVLRDAALHGRGLPEPGWPAEQVLDGPAATEEELLQEGVRVLGLDHLGREQGMDIVQTRVLERQLLEAGLRAG
ncbi:MAG: glutamate formiminotransferase [Myxococcota bacterium]|nr:glutamate formiminotransferase [Myxococcota bacterium]